MACSLRLIACSLKPTSSSFSHFYLFTFVIASWHGLLVAVFNFMVDGSCFRDGMQLEANSLQPEAYIF